MADNKDADREQSAQTSSDPQDAEPSRTAASPPLSEAELAAVDAAMTDGVNEQGGKKNSESEPIAIEAPSPPGSDDPVAGQESDAQDQTAAADPADPAEVAEADPTAAAPETDDDSPNDELDSTVETVAGPELEKARQAALDQLLGERRLSAAKMEELSVELAGLAEAAHSDLATEFRAMHTATTLKDNEVRADEEREIAATARTLEQFTSAVDQLFVELPKVAAVVQEAVEARSDEQLQSLDETLRESMGTYRHGLEIIGRMLGRSIDRKPNLVPMEVNLGAIDPEIASVSDATQFTQAIGRLSAEYHDIRDKNYHLLRDIKTDCEKQIQKTKVSLKGILSAIDGIDSGLQGEPETRASAEDASELDEASAKVVSTWYGAYSGGLATALEELLTNTELSEVEIKLGEPFDPERTEPQGVVANPEMNDDDVAVVLRRGFVFCGELIRPALVEVVKNS